MTSAAQAWARAVGMILLALGIFSLLIDWMREAEAQLTVGILAAFGTDRAVSVGGGAIIVLPVSGDTFVGVVTRGCSALASCLAGGLLVGMVLVGPGRRKVVAAVSVVALVFGANLVRLASSVAIGIWLGDAALVLFHNWFAMLFAFVYVLGSLVLGLFLILPSDSEAEPVESTT